jgi:hypothetical protein
MDQVLYNQWKSQGLPYNGVTLSFSDLIPLDNLVPLIQDVITLLKDLTIDTELYAHSDWHEHDGYITSSQIIDWEAVFRISQSGEALYENRPGDTYVRWAIYPSDLSFLLRIHILDEDEDELYPGRWGDFDITSDISLIDKIQETLSSPDSSLTIEPAMTFFDRRFAG